MGKTICVFNQKGGVGKTTTTVNLSAAIASCGKKVLIVDNDPQGNATSGVGIDRSKVNATLYTLLLGNSKIEESITETEFEGINIIASDVNLAGAEIELIDLPKREYLLERILAPIIDKYDYIFIDCPPSLGLLSLGALVAADSVLIPIQCEYYALEGVSQLLNTYNLVKKRLNPSLEIQGIVITMYDKRNNLSQLVVDEVHKYFKTTLYNTKIPRNIKLAEAPSYGMPIIYYDKLCKGSEMYSALAKEFLVREEN